MRLEFAPPVQIQIIISNRYDNFEFYMHRASADGSWKVGSRGEDGGSTYSSQMASLQIDQPDQI